MRTELEESAPPELVESAREFVFQDELDLFSKDTSSKDSKDRNLPSKNLNTDTSPPKTLQTEPPLQIELDLFSRDRKTPRIKTPPHQIKLKVIFPSV